MGDDRERLESELQRAEVARDYAIRELRDHREEWRFVCDGSPDDIASFQKTSHHLETTVQQHDSNITNIAVAIANLNLGVQAGQQNVRQWVKSHRLESIGLLVVFLSLCISAWTALLQTRQASEIETLREELEWVKSRE